MTTLDEKALEKAAQELHASRQKHGLSGEALWEHEPAVIHQIYRGNAADCVRSYLAALKADPLVKVEVIGKAK